MDRRQRKTRAAIFGAFKSLLKRKLYHKITIQEIIDIADVGRRTFYDHFETKDALLDALCRELFEHIAQSLNDRTHSHCEFTPQGQSTSMFCHILQHLQTDEQYFLRMLTRDNEEIFVYCFKRYLKELLRDETFFKPTWKALDVPKDFQIDLIASSFVEMIRWWMSNKLMPDPPTLDLYFRTMMSGALTLDDRQC